MPRQNSQSIVSLAETFVKETLESGRCFYSYGDAIVEAVLDPDTGAGRLKTLTGPDLKWYIRRVYPEQTESTIGSMAEDILHNPELPFPRIRAFVTTPTVSDNYRVITDPGYDEISGIYFSPDPGLRECKFRTNANREDAKRALETLFELLTDFPFREESGRYAYLATLLTLFHRSGIRRIVPGLAIDGNGQSVGKGLLSSMLSLIAYGHDAPTISAPKGREEWTSKLDSILLKGSPFQVIDNIVGKFASDDFASILTSTRRTVRIKGYSKIVDVPVNTVWVLNGNNLAFDSDLAQRLVTCHLQHEDAAGRDQRKFFIQRKYQCSLETLLAKDRAKYLQACLDIICGWINAGAPKRQNIILAKYGEWEAIVGGIMDWLVPEANFLADHRKEVLLLDQEREETITFLEQIMLVFPHCGIKGIKAAQIADQVSPRDGGRGPLFDYFPKCLSHKNPDADGSISRRLGKWLTTIATRRWGDIQVVPELDKKDNLFTYQIRRNPPIEQPRFDEALFENDPDIHEMFKVVN